MKHVKSQLALNFCSLGNLSLKDIGIPPITIVSDY